MGDKQVPVRSGTFRLEQPFGLIVRSASGRRGSRDRAPLPSLNRKRHLCMIGNRMFWSNSH
jgi:hypothetical protein